MPNSLWKRVAKILLILPVIGYGCLISLPKFCYRQTGHFWLQSILSSRPFDARWHSPASPFPTVNAHLNQPYHFLGGGMQSFVFISEDKTTIIKFFKHRKSILKKGRFRPYTPFLDSIFDSYHSAHTHLAKETGAFYTHLNRTRGLHPHLRLIDKCGIAHDVDLDDTEFILQPAATLVCPQITAWMKEGLEAQAKQGLTTLVTTFHSIYSKGFKSTDYAFRRNVGFIDGRAALIDAGSFVHDNTVKDPKVGKQEFLSKGLHLEKWLQKHYPTLHDHYLRAVHQTFKK